jgi:hypothetical membrane protein
MNKKILKFIQERGGYFGIIGTISIALSTLISFVIYTSIDSSFNIVSRAISDLGTGPAISSIIYSVGLIVGSFSQIPLYISLVYYFRKKAENAFLIKITTLSSLISVVSHNFLSLVPFERTVSSLYLTHGISAGFHYVAGSIALILYGINEILDAKVSNKLGLISLISGALYALLWIGYLLDFIFGISEVYVNQSFQWIAFTGIIFWSLMHSVFLIKTNKRGPVN